MWPLLVSALIAPAAVGQDASGDAPPADPPPATGAAADEPAAAADPAAPPSTQETASEAPADVPTAPTPPPPVEPPADPAADAETAYANCMVLVDDGKDASACLANVATQFATQPAGERARAVLDALRVMRASGVQLAEPTPESPSTETPEAPPSKPESESQAPPIEFGDIVARVPLTVSGVGFGIANGVGLASMAGLLLEPLNVNDGVFVLGGGVVSVGAAVGMGAAGYLLSDKDSFTGTGAWLGSGGMLMGSAMGFAFGLGVSDVLSAFSWDGYVTGNLTPAMWIGSALVGGYVGTGLGLFGSRWLQLDDDQVAIVNGAMVLGGVAAFTSALTAGDLTNMVMARHELTAASTTFVLVSGASIAGGVAAAEFFDFNAGEVLVISLAGLASTGAMAAAAASSAYSLGLGGRTVSFVGASSTVANLVGAGVTAGILVALRDDVRPLLKELPKVQVGTPMVVPDGRGGTLVMGPTLGGQF